MTLRAEPPTPPSAERSREPTPAPDSNGATQWIDSAERASGAVIAPAAARRLFSVLFTVALLAASTYLIPPLYELQPWKRSEDYVPFWNIVGRHFRGDAAELDAQRARFERLRQDNSPTVATAPLRAQQPTQVSRKVATFPAYEPHPDDQKPPEVPLENAVALDHYYRRLTLVELGAPRTLARASHWGDSLLGDDGLTFAIRSRLQARFGDGGHGFHALAPLNAFYFHRGIRFKVVAPWSSRCELLFNCEADRRFGLGGVSSRSYGGSHSRYSTAKAGPGEHVSHFELWYEKSPTGGMFEVRIDDDAVHPVDTRAPERSDEVAAFELEDGPHTISVHTVRGSVRGYGVVLERAGPGVVWENLAVIGTFTNTLNRQDPEHIANQVRLRNPDLLVFSLGGNDAQRGAGDIRQNYEPELVNALRRYRAGRPAASCLIIAVTAHGERNQYGGVQVRRSVPEMVLVQRKVALAEGCGFFDLYTAMGGAASIEQWYTSRPPLLGGDLGHPTSEGHAVLASLTYRALMAGYADYRRRAAGKPFAELGQLAAPADSARAP
jgi:lysophospholipase L1-like esterase